MTSSITSLVTKIADRMSDPDALAAFMNDPINRNPDRINPNLTTWENPSLAGGYSGLLLLFSVLQKKNLLEKKQNTIVHQYVLKIKESIEKNGIASLSLFSGLAGICFAIQQASNDGTRYENLLKPLHEILLTNIENIYLVPIKENIFNKRASSSALQDVVQGLSGIGRYVLENRTNPLFHNLTLTIINNLIALIQPILIKGQSVPGWYLEQDDILNQLNRDPSKFNFNLGLAHGIPGILTFLSIALIKGIKLEGQIQAIQTIVHWIRKKSFVTNCAIQWPCAVSFNEEINAITPSNEASRDAWCYGAPGIARSLYLAGKALNDENLKKFAGAAFRGIFSRTRKQWNIPGPSLCHGIAGLLLITNEMSKEAGFEDLKVNVLELEKILLSYYNPDYSFGFKTLEVCTDGRIAQVSDPGLLEGTAGILLTLLHISNPSSKWHLPFMLTE